MSKRVLFIQHCHMDPVWRRCFDRPATCEGITMPGYAVLEAAQINRWLELAPRGYTFSEGQVAVWRKYLQRYPEKRAVIREYARQGLLDVMLAGETVQDSNMPAAEGLIRNFLLAMPFYHDLVGADHPALKLAWLEDAFGNSPNLPQILRGVGAEVACKLSYRPLADDVWVGIDGTPIYLLDQYPKHSTGAFEKLGPCAQCLGVGCPCCDESGIDFTDDRYTPNIGHIVDAAVDDEHEWAVACCDYEEFRPSHVILNAVYEKAAEHAGRCAIAFGNFSDIYRQLRPRLEAAADQRDDSPSPDLNPGMPGCYVTHIKNKQRVRAISYKLLVAESLLANDAWQRGVPAAPPADLDLAWQRVLFNQFHDAITGTHIDQANEELHDMLDEAESLVDAYLPAPPHPTPPDVFHPVVSEQTTVQLGELTLTVDRCGILAISCAGEDLFGALPHPLSRLRPFRIAELVLEDDWGDAWGMRKAHSGAPHADYSAIALGDWHDSLEVAGGAIRWRGVYRGSSPRINRLAWTVTITPAADGRRLDFTVDVDWDTCSHRLRVYLPVRSDDECATYEVPFGFIERRYDPALLDYSEWNSNTLEFPALHWVNKRIDEQRGVALFNKGLPCNRWAPGAFDLSLLRSPQMGFCSLPYGRLDVWDLDGWRDTGKHRCEFAVMPYTNGVTESELTRLGYAYNLPAPLAPPFRIEGDDVMVTAWKPAQDGSGWILRLQETAGSGASATLIFEEERHVTRVNLLEEKTDKAQHGNHHQFDIHKHGILTVHISAALTGN